MRPIDTQFKTERRTLRAHLGAAMLTGLVLLAIASTGAGARRLEPRQDKERAVYYLAPPREQVETASSAPKSPAPLETFSVDLRDLRETVELNMEPLELAYSPELSADAYLEFDADRDFQAAAPNLDDLAPFVIFDSSEVDEKPQIRYSKHPEVPGPLRGREVEVIVFYYVDTRGRTERQSVLSSTSDDPAYGQAAKEAISAWRFKPAQRAGKPVPCWVQQTIRFSGGSASPFSI